MMISLSQKVTEGILHLPLPSDVFIELIRHCFDSNSFSFNRQYFSQNFGVAMGSPLSPWSCQSLYGVLWNFFSHYWYSSTLSLSGITILMMFLLYSLMPLVFSDQRHESLALYNPLGREASVTTDGSCQSSSRGFITKEFIVLVCVAMKLARVQVSKYPSYNLSTQTVKQSN